MLKPYGFIEELPKKYKLNFKPNSYLYNRSNVVLNSEQTKQRYFLSYELHATMKLFKARHNINRGKILTRLDLIYKDENFKRFQGLPVRDLDSAKLRIKKRLAKGKILYMHDIEELPYVLKNRPVNVRLIYGNVHLEFQAISLEDGHKGEYVFIKKADGKKLKSKVINRNLVEVE